MRGLSTFVRIALPFSALVEARDSHARFHARDNGWPSGSASTSATISPSHKSSHSSTHPTQSSNQSDQTSCSGMRRPQMLQFTTITLDGHPTTLSIDLPPQPLGSGSSGSDEQWSSSGDDEWYLTTVTVQDQVTTVTVSISEATGTYDDGGSGTGGASSGTETDNGSDSSSSSGGDSSSGLASSSSSSWSHRGGGGSSASSSGSSSSRSDNSGSGQGSADGGGGVATESIAPSVSSEIIHPTRVPYQPFGTWGVKTGKNALSQQAQNGQSNLGLLNSPTLPKWLGQSDSPSRGSSASGASSPGSSSASSPGSSSSFPSFGGSSLFNNSTAGTNTSTSVLHTGVTRNYNFVISRGVIAPDGVERDVLLINGAFPAPTIEANYGDTISVTVTNSITNPEEGTALHWHGLLQTRTQYYDGVPGIQQCPIAPGQTFTYTFTADLYGTSWYHAHYSAQYAGGLVGAMIIYGPNNVDYDLDLGPVLLTDYYHKDYFTIVEEVMGTDLSQVAPQSVNNLINGKGQYNCSLITANTTCTPNAGYSKFGFQTGKAHRLRLINAGAEGIQKFSIDNHQLEVTAYDFVPIVPYTTAIVTLGVGQRADVVVKATGKSTDAVWMRSTISACSLATQPNGLAMIYYPFANNTAVPTTMAWNDTTSPCANDALSSIVPYSPMTPSTPSTTITINLGFGVNSTGHLVWTMNNSTFRVDYNDPILLLAAQGNDSYPYSPEWNVYNVGSNSSIRVELINLTPVAHPMHLHGHNMYVLAEGTGSWDGTVVNPYNPTRRDVQMLQPNGYLVMQFDADNPGVWPFHCHIAWHVSGGLYVNFLEAPDSCKQIKIPQNVYDTCTTWQAYTNADVVDQIDSGL